MSVQLWMAWVQVRVVRLGCSRRGCRRASDLLLSHHVLNDHIRHVVSVGVPAEKAETSSR